MDIIDREDQAIRKLPKFPLVIRKCDQGRNQADEPLRPQSENIGRIQKVSIKHQNLNSSLHLAENQTDTLI